MLRNFLRRSTGWFFLWSLALFLAARPRVGMAGFEPATSCSQGRRITRLSYIPMNEQPVRESNPPLRLERAESFDR